jgi:hypothetical protein
MNEEILALFLIFKYVTLPEETLKVVYFVLVLLLLGSVKVW